MSGSLNQGFAEMKGRFDREG